MQAVHWATVLSAFLVQVRQPSSGAQSWARAARAPSSSVAATRVRAFIAVCVAVLRVGEDRRRSKRD